MTKCMASVRVKTSRFSVPGGLLPVIFFLASVACCSPSREPAAALEMSPPANEAVDTMRTPAFRFVFYNVENLFDPYDDPQTEDDEFLPWGMKGWNEERFDHKLRRLFKVFANIGGWDYPDIVGLCEIENRYVLEELLERTPLKEADYGIIHEDSPDARGIDLGFLYRRERFAPITFEAIGIRFPFDSLYHTRDLLHVEGVARGSDTLHIFLCHFPSRRGGEAASEPRRLFVAGVLRARIDSILASRPDAGIIVTGDFNDEPINRSILEVLRADGDWCSEEAGQLFNFMYSQQVRQGAGTYKFQGFWNMLDQFIVSSGLREDGKGMCVLPHSAVIYREPWLLQDDDRSPGGKPFRTHSGAHYIGGFSDHLPIYLDLYSRK